MTETEFARQLLAAGVPVVVCRPRAGWKPGDTFSDVIPPSGWAIITAAECDLSKFRAGVDALAMVGGHGVDVVDVDTKDAGSVDNLPPFRQFGQVRTPSGGSHHYVRSTGIGKISPLRTSAGHVGDYVGGTVDGGSRLLAFLPGSTRPKYPNTGYTIVEPLDLDALVEHEPDDDLINALVQQGGSRDGMPGKPAADWAATREFHAAHSQTEATCRYGRAAIANLVLDADSAVPGDPARGRHGWAVRSATRCVELIRGGCATSADLDQLGQALDRIKPEGGTDWGGCIAWALANAGGSTGCGLHNPKIDAGEKIDPDTGEIFTDEDQDSKDELHSDQGEGPRQTPFERMVLDEAQKIRIREAARVLVDEAKRKPTEPFDAGTLSEILARPPDPPARIEELLPWEASMLLSAQRKAGKTTMQLNMARSMLTGEDFLGKFGVRPLDGDVAFLNFEVSGAQLGRWAADVGVPADRFYLVNLRGRRNPLSDPQDRARLAEVLRARGVESVFCDPFGRAFTGASQNDAGEVQQFLVSLDLFARSEVGAKDLILSAHAGWNGERTRGSSALEDWADSLLTLTKDDSDEGQGERYLRAVGRDVELDEDRLDFDGLTRRLTLAGAGSRKTQRATGQVDGLVPVVVNIVNQEPGINTNGIRSKVSVLRESGQVTGRDSAVNKAIKQAVDRGLIRMVLDGQKHTHYPTEAHQGPTKARPHLGTEATEAIRPRFPVTSVDDSKDNPASASVRASCSTCGKDTLAQILNSCGGLCNTCYSTDQKAS